MDRSSPTDNPTTPGEESPVLGVLGEVFPKEKVRSKGQQNNSRVWTDRRFPRDQIKPTEELIYRREIR